MPSRMRSHGDSTRSALLHSGLSLFGNPGYDATSIRQLAAHADTNIASVNYHFGGKEGLRNACADLIVHEFSQVAQGLLKTNLDSNELTREQASELLLESYTKVARFLLTTDKNKDWVPFIMRELMHPSAALERIYFGVYGPAHTKLCLIWHLATGLEAESEQTRLTLFSLIGQLVYFRIARPIIERRMEWTSIDEPQVEKILSVLTNNVKLILSAAQTASEVSHD